MWFLKGEFWLGTRNSSSLRQSCSSPYGLAMTSCFQWYSLPILSSPLLLCVSVAGMAARPVEPLPAGTLSLEGPKRQNSEKCDVLLRPDSVSALTSRSKGGMTLGPEYVISSPIFSLVSLGGNCTKAEPFLV